MHLGITDPNLTQILYSSLYDAALTSNNLMGRYNLSLPTLLPRTSLRCALPGQTQFLHRNTYSSRCLRPAPRFSQANTTLIQLYSSGTNRFPPANATLVQVPSSGTNRFRPGKHTLVQLSSSATNTFRPANLTCLLTCERPDLDEWKRVWQVEEFFDAIRAYDYSDQYNLTSATRAAAAPSSYKPPNSPPKSSPISSPCKHIITTTTTMTCTNPTTAAPSTTMTPKAAIQLELEHEDTFALALGAKEMHGHAADVQAFPRHPAPPPVLIPPNAYLLKPSPSVGSLLPALSAATPATAHTGEDPRVLTLALLTDNAHAAGADYAGDEGEDVKSFLSYCGGLPSPDCTPNTLLYKFSWSSRGVLLACFPSHAQPTLIPGGGTQLMQSAAPIKVGVFGFEGYANRDSVPFAELYNIPEAEEVLRGTLR
ncbi:hypothetical protein BU17DRAFT_83833 [Hysterangium stoloniferum]|nr:hypothetical protein BU17DRAFT_83833 [Hysterangium stoloniferum]